jgi:electron transport complex protein RnfE
MSLTFLGAVREIIGNGTLFGQAVMWESYEPFSVMVKAPGAFICLGVILGVINWISAREQKKG